ncbi:hypothetical protein [Nocardia testacea]|nr:hypothetical protein [Nocardia testacea]
MRVIAVWSAETNSAAATIGSRARDDVYTIRLAPAIASVRTALER